MSESSGEPSGAVLGNEPADVLAGHALDRDALARWLRGAVGLAGELELREFGGGYSNVTYLVRAGARELVLRRGPFGVVVKGAHDVGREYKALVGLAPMWTKSPRPVAFCDDPEVIGAPFYLMERVDGVVLRRDATGLSPEVMRRLSESLCDTLVEFHAIDYERAGLASLGRPAGFLERQVAGWTDRYRTAQTDELADVEVMAAWIAAHIPAPHPPTLLHNDFKFDNVLVDRALTSVVCVLDWEMCTLGDPLVDLGTALALWQEATDPPGLDAARFVPTHLPGNLTRLQFAERYAAATGRSLEHLPWYYVFGLYRMLVSLQQLYRRYVIGATTEPRYARMLDAVRGMAAAGAAVIENGRMQP